MEINAESLLVLTSQVIQNYVGVEFLDMVWEGHKITLGPVENLEGFPRPTGIVVVEGVEVCKYHILYLRQDEDEIPIGLQVTRSVFDPAMTMFPLSVQSLASYRLRLIFNEILRYYKQTENQDADVQP